MMSVPAAVFYVLGAIVAVDTALVLLLLKRYGQVVRALKERSRAPLVRTSEPLPAGSPLPEFSAHSVGGVPVSAAEFTGAGGIIAFFGAQCAPCHAQAPTIAALAAAPEGAGPVLAVVSGPAEDAAEILELLGDALPVVHEGHHGPVARSFQVSRYPTFFEVDVAGTITNVVHVVDALSGAMAPAAA